MKKGGLSKLVPVLTTCIAIIGSSYALEALLSGSIPPRKYILKIN